MPRGPTKKPEILTAPGQAFGLGRPMILYLLGKLIDQLDKGFRHSPDSSITDTQGAEISSREPTRARCWSRSRETLARKVEAAGMPPRLRAEPDFLRQNRP